MRLNHADRRLREAKRLGEEDAERVRILRGRPDGQLLRVGVPRRGVRAGLDRRRDVPLRLHDAADDAHAGGAERAARVALGELLADHHVVAPRWLDERARRVERGLGVVHDGQLLVHDVDELERPVRSVAVFRDDHRNRLTDVPRPVGRQGADGEALAAVEARVGGGRDGVGLARYLVAGEDVDDPRLGQRPHGVDRHDPGVRVGAAEHGHRAHAVERDVRDVLSVPADELPVRQPGHAATNVLHRCWAAAWIDSTMN